MYIINNQKYIIQIALLRDISFNLIIIINYKLNDIFLNKEKQHLSLN